MLITKFWYFSIQTPVCFNKYLEMFTYEHLSMPLPLAQGKKRAVNTSFFVQLSTTGKLRVY